MAKSAGHRLKFDEFHSKLCIDSEGRDHNKQTNKQTNIKLILRVLVFYDPTHTPTFLHKHLKLFDRIKI